MSGKDYTSLPYIKSLDGLRALAAIMVVFFHSPVPFFQCQFGWAGVNLFFILSGFLITRILIHSRRHSFTMYASCFYLRRSLRIFPLYYFYLIISISLLLLLNHVFAGSDEMIRQGIADFNINYPYLVTYTYNFEEVINFLRTINYDNSLFYGHLWSLSVEEQFYLLYPVIVYLIPVNILKKLLLVVIILIPFLRLLAVTILKEKVADLFWIGDVLYISTIFQLDTLSMGACLALFDLKRVVQKRAWWLSGVVAWVVMIGLVHITLFTRYGIPSGDSSLGYDAPVYHLLYKTPYELLNNRFLYLIPVINGFFALLVLLAIHGRLLPQLFENRWLVKVGKISYGVYIYHLGFSYGFNLLVTTVFHSAISKLPVIAQFGAMLVYLCLLFVLADMSYRFWEINKGIDKCKKECDFFHVCGGGAPANKYFENGTFNSAETKYCNYNIKMPTELVLAYLEEQLSLT